MLDAITSESSKNSLFSLTFLESLAVADKQASSLGAPEPRYTCGITADPPAVSLIPLSSKL
jgi:hypothetical protein